jgi:uncharacterized protein YbaP (TraB family)
MAPMPKLSRRCLGLCLAFLLLVPALVLPAAAKEQRVHGQGRLFKVTAAGIPPSYVFGTMHVTDPEVLHVPTPVARAFDDSTRLLLELLFTPEIETRMTEAMLLSDGRNLSDVVGPEIYGKLLKRAAAYGLPARQVNRFRPWAAALIFSVPVGELDRSASGILALDRALQQEADKRGIKVFGLETLEEQVAAFGDMPEADQIASLRLTLELNPNIDALFADMKQAYLKGDLDKLHAMSMSMLGNDPRLVALFEKEFIEMRNRRMVDRMARHLKQGGAFVAVGALHLSGENGILSLLEKHGYKVSRVY